jgi:hypothetical protein
LQFSPLSPFLDAELRARFDAQRSADIANQASWLDAFFAGADLPSALT